MDEKYLKQNILVYYCFYINMRGICNNNIVNHLNFAQRLLRLTTRLTTEGKSLSV